MGTSNIVDLLTGIFFIGLFFLSMISGAILLINNEGRGEIFEGYEEFESFNLNLSNALTGNTQELGNININLSANYNPELAISAACQSCNDMAGISASFMTETWDLLSVFIGLIFGNVWTTTLSLLVSSILLVLISFYFVKFIRSGN